MRAVIADTGPLYAELDQDDQYHHRAVFELDRLNNSQTSLVILTSTLAEAHRLVLYKCGFNIASSFVERSITNVSLVDPTSKDYQLAYELLKQYPDQKITLFDALIAVLFQQTNVPVWTYDYHFDIMNVSVWR
ncbi:MAG: type II toxin-antitoxin system VapC family toxin [Elainellaceae cyanobacterium]